MVVVSSNRMIAHCNTKAQSRVKLPCKSIICEDTLAVVKGLQIRLADSEGEVVSKGKSVSQRAMKKLASPIV